MLTRTKKNYEKKAMVRELVLNSDIFMSLHIAFQRLLQSVLLYQLSVWTYGARVFSGFISISVNATVNFTS